MRTRLRSIAAWSLLAIPALLAACSSSDPAPTPTGVVRTYYIAAEDVAWNYAPTGVNQITGEPFANLSTPNPLRESSEQDEEFVMTRRVAFDIASTAIGSPNFTTDSAAIQIGTTYKKSLFQEYTSASFTVKKPRDAKWEHTGFLGPIIRAEVGDTIRVVFKNKTQTTRNFSMHPHGVFYTKPNEGAPYFANNSSSFTAGNSVPPGSTYTYTWQVPDRAGPGPADGPSVQWMYHSHVDETKDTYSGLVGPMIVYAPGMLRPDGSVVGIDREFVVMFTVDNENMSWHFFDNLQTYAKVTLAQIDAAIIGPPPASLDGLLLNGFNDEPNLKHSMNGYIFGNLPLETLTMHKGEHVRWYVFSMGTEVDLHTPHWHGNTVLVNGMRTDVVDLLPASMVTADMVPDNIGTWLFHCHVNDHIIAGMIERYQVLP
ncbi:MAG TPA: multicopper oxidase domain-containing protein [Geobacteraceae bacterium]